jgi:hypothetical protein
MDEEYLLERAAMSGNFRQKETIRHAVAIEFQ